MTVNRCSCSSVQTQCKNCNDARLLAPSEISAVFHTLETCLKSGPGVSFADREDVIQDVIVAVLEHPGLLSELNPARLYYLARNAIARYRRKAVCAVRHHPRLLSLTLERLARNEGRDQELRVSVQSAINQLPERERFIVLAVEIEGRQQKGVAIELGISEAYLSILLQRALELLVSMLREEI
jgi:RNA polymerase sigma factor (sigma-70 family)